MRGPTGGSGDPPHQTEVLVRGRGGCKAAPSPSSSLGAYRPHQNVTEPTRRQQRVPSASASDSEARSVLKKLDCGAPDSQGPRCSEAKFICTFQIVKVRRNSFCGLSSLQWPHTSSRIRMQPQRHQLCCTLNAGSSNCCPIASSIIQNKIYVSVSQMALK